MVRKSGVCIQIAVMFGRGSSIAALVILVATLGFVLYELSDKTSRNWGETLNEMLPQAMVLSSCLIVLTASSFRNRH